MPQVQKDILKVLGPYSQNFFFFVTYVWAQKARALEYTERERLANGKHSREFGPFVNYEGNEVFRI